MQEARENAVVTDHGGAASNAAAAAGSHVVSSVGSAERLRKWLQHCVSFPVHASLAELEALVEEERAAIAEEEAAMAQYDASMESRGQPTS